VSWEEKTSNKNARREIHRSLYKLSQKGIQPERAVEQAPARPILAPVEPEGYASPIDGRGDRLVWLVKLKAGGGLHYLAAVINEPDGMQHVEGAEITRKGFRAMRDDIGTRFGFTMIEVPWRYCDFLMHEGYERAKGRGVTTVEAYPAYRSHLLSIPAQPAELPLPVVPRMLGDPTPSVRMAMVLPYLLKTHHVRLQLVQPSHDLMPTLRPPRPNQRIDVELHNPQHAIRHAHSLPAPVPRRTQIVTTSPDNIH